MRALLSRLGTAADTPLELVLFFATFVGVVMAFALVVYVALILSMWLVRASDDVPVRDLFLPPAPKVRSWIGDVALGLLTTVVLVFTLATKGQLIQRIEAVPLSDLLASGGAGGSGRCDVNPLLLSAFPLHDVSPPACEGLKKLVDVKSGEVLRPLLQTGVPERAAPLVEALAEQVLAEPTGLARYVNAFNLRILGVAVMLLYLTWAASARVAELKAEKGHAAVPPQTGRRLLSISVCLALLTLNVAMVADARALSAAVISALRAAEAPASEQVRVAIVLQELERQEQALRVLLPDGSHPTDNVWAAMARLQAHLEQLDGRVSNQSSQLQATDASLKAGLAQAQAVADSLQKQVDDVKADHASLETSLQELLAAQKLAAAADQRRDDELSKLAGLCSGCNATLNEVRARLEADRVALETLRSQLKALSDRGETKGTLILFQGYAGQQLGVGTLKLVPPGVLELDPGDHLVRDLETGERRSVRVQAGKLSGVMVEGRPTQGTRPGLTERVPPVPPVQ